MRLKRDWARLAVTGSTSGSWSSRDGRWLFRRGKNGSWLIVPARISNPEFDTEDDIFLASLGLADPFPTRASAVAALANALESTAAC